jgi:hypothetical protein
MVEIWRDIFKNTPRHIRKRKNFRFPPILPIVLYNGKYNWTASRDFQEILNKNPFRRKFIPGFEYLLIDVNRYDEKDLLKTANLISSVFYMEQKRDTDEVYLRLENLVTTLEDLDSNQFNLFISWIKKVVYQGLSEEMQKKVLEILEKNLEVNSMISNITKTLKEEYKRQWQAGIKQGHAEGKREGKLEAKMEAVVRLLTKKFGQLSEDMVRKIYAANESQLELIIDNIFQIQSLDEVGKYLK